MQHSICLNQMHIEKKTTPAFKYKFIQSTIYNSLIECTGHFVCISKQINFKNLSHDTILPASDK